MCKVNAKVYFSLFMERISGRGSKEDHKVIEVLLHYPSVNVGVRVNSKPVNTPPKKETYQRLNKRLHNLVSNPHTNSINQITALAHNSIL